MIFRLRDPSGFSAISTDGTTLAAWNLYDGIDIYNIASRKEHVDNVELPDAFSQNVFMNMACIHDDQDILVGSSVGKPMIINLATKKVTQVLAHSHSEHSMTRSR